MKGHKLRILRITEYKGFHIMVQNYENLCQFVAFRDDNYYQGHAIITPAKGEKKHSPEDLVKIGTVMLDYAFATCEAILFKDDPDKLLEANRQAADVVS